MNEISSLLTWVPAFGGHLALSHRPKKNAFAGLRADGCTAVLTLLSEREGAAAIGVAATRAALTWLWLPLASGDPPAAARAVEIRAALDAALGLLAAGGRLLVHCSAGIHRTGMIGNALLRHAGLGPAHAREALRALRAVTADGVGGARLAWGDELAQPIGNTR